MDEAKTIKPKAGQKLEVNKILNFAPARIFFFPIPPYAQNFPVVLGYGYNIRQFNPGVFAIVPDILITWNVQVNMALQ